MGGLVLAWVKGLQFLQGLALAFMWSLVWWKDLGEKEFICSQQTGMKVR